MTDPHDANLQLRVRALRLALAQTTEHPPGTRLSGEGGWREHPRCPWNTKDDPALARKQLAATLESTPPRAIVSVGHWGIVEAGRYRAAVTPYRGRLVSGKTAIVFGVGAVDAELQGLLDARLVHGLVSADFPGIGRAVAKQMRAAAQGESVPPQVFLPSEMMIAPTGTSTTSRPARAPR